jgi:uncharacterized protein
MRFFDCNCSFGMPGIPVFRYAISAVDLLEEMAYCGIERALVYHASMRFGSPIIGNPQVVAETHPHPQLRATWAVLPLQTGELPEPEELLKAMQRQGVAALRAFPNEHRYTLDRRTFGPLLELLQQRRVPLLVKQDLVHIGQLLADFPQLVLVAVNQGPHSLERYLRPLVEAYPHLYVDTSYYMVDGLIEEFCTRYGPERLLFGTAFPDNCSGAALLRLAQADIPERDREAVASQNLERILQEAQW